MQLDKAPIRFESVQVLRAVAALLVVLVHAINSNDFRTDTPRAWLGSIGQFNNFGASGVDMFFVVSGFIMAHAMLAPSADSPGRFIINRWIRVVPYYWICSLLFLGLMWLMGRTFETAQFFSSLTVFPIYDTQVFLPPLLFVGWTLAFELAFYGVVAVAIGAASDRSRRLLVVFQIVALLGLLGYQLAPQADLLAIWFNPIWFEFGLGIAVYALWKRSAGLVSPAIALSVVAVGIASLVHSATFGWPYTDQHWGILNQGAGLDRALRWGLPAAEILCGLLWLDRSKAGEMLRGNVVWHGLVMLGDASYSLYLLHLGIIFLYEDLMPTNALNPDMMILVLVAVSCGVSLAAYRWIEQPLLVWLRSLTGKPSKTSQSLLPA